MGLTQKEAARRMGASQTSDLSRYEHGVKFPSLINALKLEIVYRTPVAFLFEDLYQELKEEIRKQEENAKCEDDQK